MYRTTKCLQHESRKSGISRFLLAVARRFIHAASLDQQFTWLRVWPAQRDVGLRHSKSEWRLNRHKPSCVSGTCKGGIPETQLAAFSFFFFFLKKKKKFEWKWKFSTCSPVTISSVTENKGAEEREVWSEVSRYDMCIILPSVCCRGKRHQRELNRFTCGTAAGECTFKAPFLCMLAYLSW